MFVNKDNCMHSITTTSRISLCRPYRCTCTHLPIRLQVDPLQMHRPNLMSHPSLYRNDLSTIPLRHYITLVGVRVCVTIFSFAIPENVLLHAWMSLPQSANVKVCANMFAVRCPAHQRVLLIRWCKWIPSWWILCLGISVKLQCGIIRVCY